jgi:ribose transport system substrate-binding protein
MALRWPVLLRPHPPVETDQIGDAMRRRDRVAITLIALPVLGVSVACSSSGGSSAATPSSSTSPASPASTAATTSNVAAAKAKVAALAESIKIDYSPGPLPGNPAGKKIDIVSNTTPTGIHSSNLFAQAAQLLGIKTQIVLVGNSAEQIANAFNQIVNQVDSSSVQGIIAGGIDPTAWQQQFNQLVAKHIPIVLYASTYNPAWNTKSVISIESVRTGVSAAAGDVVDWVTADSGGTANAVLFNVSGAPILQSVADAMNARFKAICPGCTLAEQNVDITSIGTSLPGEVVSYLQAHPATKYVLVEFGDMTTGVPQAINAAGITGVKIATTTATSTDLAYIKSGQEAVNFSYPLNYIAYVGADAVARGMLTGDMSYSGKWVMPVQLLDEANVNSPDFNSDGTSNPPGLEAYFKKLWNLK